jgi:hypothetical protein
MKEAFITDNTTSIVDAKEIIDSISRINSKLYESKNTAENLINNVNESSESLVKAQNDNSIRRRIGGWSSESLFSFIVNCNNATHTSVSAISKLIQNSNDNSKLLAEMIGKLAMLSGLSFKNTSETTAQLEEMAKKFEQSSSSSTEQAVQIKRVILAHINKIKEEKKIADKIEFNFGVINDNLKKLDEKLNANNIKNEKRIILIKELLNSQSEEHFIKVQNKQKKIIDFFAVFSVVTFLILISFVVYYFKVT